MPPALFDFELYAGKFDREVSLANPIDYRPDNRPYLLGSCEERGLTLLNPSPRDRPCDVPAEEEIEQFLDRSDKLLGIFEQWLTV